MRSNRSEKCRVSGGDGGDGGDRVLYTAPSLVTPKSCGWAILGGGLISTAFDCNTDVLTLMQVLYI
jgi:hypothetical protein